MTPEGLKRTSQREKSCMSFLLLSIPQKTVIAHSKSTSFNPYCVPGRMPQLSSGASILMSPLLLQLSPLHRQPGNLFPSGQGRGRHQAAGWVRKPHPDRMKADLKPVKESTVTAPLIFFSFLGLHGLAEVATVPQFQPEDIQPKQECASLGDNRAPHSEGSWE